MTRGIAPLLLIALLLGVPACGATEDPVDEDGHPIPWRPPQREYLPVEVPQVRNARRTPDRPRPVVAGVLPSGDCSSGQRQWWKLVSEGEADRRDALDGFGKALAARLADDPASSVELHADGGARWEDVRDVLERMLAAPGCGDRVRWAVRVEEVVGRVHQGGRVTREALRGSDASDVRIALRPAPGGEADEMRVELVVGDWSTRSREMTSYGPSREATAAAWRAAAPAIRSALGDGDRVRLRVLGEQGAHVRWGHVVAALDVLLGLDVRRIALPALDVELQLDAPEVLGELPPQPPDDPVFAPLVAFLATFMVLFALAITLIPAWFERSARKRPRGRGTS